ncbi:MAG: hypothetical protein MJY85_10650 [Fibrobacter sp.]|nr:hypothetical protein [Fibrobacter sp.]
MRSLKTIVLLCALITGLAFAQEPVKRQSRLFMDVELGLSHSHYGYPSKEFDGLGPVVDLKFGGAHSSQSFVFFAAVKYSQVLGSIGSMDASGYRFFLGGGTAWYPFDGGDSPMHGAFVGVSAGIMMIAADWRGQSMMDTFAMGSTCEIEEQGFSLAFELGKTWPITEKWRLGFVVTSAVDLPVRYGEGKYENDLYSIGASVRFARK